MTIEQLSKLTKDVLVANLEVLSKDESLDGRTIQQIAAGLVGGVAATLVAISDEQVSKLEATDIISKAASAVKSSIRGKQIVGYVPDEYGRMRAQIVGYENDQKGEKA